MAISILIADDHPMFREALRGILEHSAIAAHASFFQAASLLEVQQKLQELPDLDLLLLDLNMPGAQGLSGLAHLRGCFPSVPIFIISGSDQPHVIRQVRELGALGFMSKTESPQNIVKAVSSVLQGNEYFPEISREFYRIGLDAEAVELAERLAQLTPQQFIVYSMVVQGMLNKQIAHELDIALPTAKSHVTAIFRKLQVRDRKQLIVLANKLNVRD